MRVREIRRGRHLDRAVGAQESAAAEFVDVEQADAVSAVANAHTLCYHPARRSLEIVDMTRPLPVPSDLDDLVRRYLAGESAEKLKRERGVSQGTIWRWLGMRGVKPRGRSEARRALWAEARASGDYQSVVQRTCSAAWRAVTGRVRSIDERMAMAKTMSGRARVLGKNELELIRELERRGVGCSWQRNIGPYNVDLFTHEPPVAVEVQREHSNPRTSNSGAHSLRAERLERIRSEGSALFIVYCPPTYKWRGKTPIKGSLRERFDAAKVADKLIAFLDVVRALPSTKSQYGVVSGYGQPRSLCGVDFDKWTRVAGF